MINDFGTNYKLSGFDATALTSASIAPESGSEDIVGD